MSDAPPPAEPPPRTAVDHEPDRRLLAAASRLLVVLMTLVLIGVGRLVAEPPAGRCLSRSVAAHGRDHHPMARPRRRGSGAADHRAGRDRHERHSADRRRPARSRSTACPTSSSPSRTAPTTISPARRCSTACRASRLPDGVTPSVSPLSSPSGLIYRYVLQSPDRSPMELKTFEDWVDRAAVSSPSPASPTIPASAAAPCSTRCCSIRRKLAGVGLSVQQVETALAANNSNAGGGFYSQGGQFYYVRGLGRLEHAGGHRQRRPGGAQRHAGPGQGCRPRGHRHRAAPGRVRLREAGRRRRRRDPAAHRREDPGRAQAASRPRPRNSTTQILPKDVKVVPFYDRTDLIDLTTHDRRAATCCAACCWSSWSWSSSSTTSAPA